MGLLFGSYGCQKRLVYGSYLVCCACFWRNGCGEQRVFLIHNVSFSNIGGYRLLEHFVIECCVLVWSKSTICSLVVATLFAPICIGFCFGFSNYLWNITLQLIVVDRIMVLVVFLFSLVVRVWIVFMLWMER